MLITWFHQPFLRNLLSFKQLKCCQLHLQYLRINKQKKKIVEKIRRFVDSGFVKLCRSEPACASLLNGHRIKALITMNTKDVTG